MDSFSLRVTLAVMAFGIRGLAQPGITKEDVDKQQQQLNKDRWQYIRDSLDLQKRAEQELLREKGALIDHIKGALEQAASETSPVLKIEMLFEEKEVQSAFRDALHGDLKSWFTTIGKRAAQEIANKLSEEAPAWADPELLQRMLDIGSQLISMKSEAKQQDLRAADILKRQTAITEARKKLLANSNGCGYFRTPVQLGG